jgi:hypothetical protein
MGNGSTDFAIDLAGSGKTDIYSTSILAFHTALTERMRISSAGNLNIGYAGDQGSRCYIQGGGTTLYLKGNTSTSFGGVIASINSSSTDLFSVRNDGLFGTGTATNAPYNYSTSGRSLIVNSSGEIGYLVSTRESKSKIESIKNVDFINQLNPVQFNYRKKDNIANTFTDELYDNITYGFIADEVEKVNKELVFYNIDGSLAGVEYNNMIAILTKAIQELKAEINELKNK